MNYVPGGQLLYATCYGAASLSINLTCGQDFPSMKTTTFFLALVFLWYHTKTFKAESLSLLVPGEPGSGPGGPEPGEAVEEPES